LHCIDEAEELLGGKDKLKMSRAMDRMLVAIFDRERKA